MIMMRNMHPMAAGMLALACLLAIVFFSIDQAFISTQSVKTSVLSKRVAKVSNGKNTGSTHDVPQVCFDLKGTSQCRYAPPELFDYAGSGTLIHIEFTEGRITGERKITSVRIA